MSILNVTPDSFSDGGEAATPEAAAAKARRLAAAGADIIDIGAESTRPGAPEVSPGEEASRLFPALEAVRAAVDVPLSIDTRRAGIAVRALAAGATMINDVSGLEDPATAEAVAAAGGELVIMHGYREHLEAPETDPERMEISVSQVADFIGTRMGLALAAGVPAEKIIADPGLGFGKSHRESELLLTCAGELRKALGVRVLIAPSRKRFLRRLWRSAAPFDRDAASLAAMRLAQESGADIVRMHLLRLRS